MDSSRIGYGLDAKTVKSLLMKAPDSHQDVELNCVETGSLTYFAGGGDVTLRAGELVVFWGAVPHQIIAKSGSTTLHYIHIPLPWVLQWKLSGNFYRSLMAGSFLRAKTHLGRDIDIRQMRGWVADITSKDSELQKIALAEIRSRLMRLARDKMPAEAEKASELPRGEGMIRMARYITEHYTEDIYTETIAATAGLAPGYALEQFHKRFGVTVTDFVNQHRVWHARRLLIMSNRQIANIACDAGFGSITQFNALFKKITGMSPREYRKSC